LYEYAAIALKDCVSSLNLIVPLNNDVHDEGDDDEGADVDDDDVR